MDVFAQLSQGWRALCTQTAPAFARWPRREPALGDVEDLDRARCVLHTTGASTADDRDVLLLPLLRRVEARRR